MVVSIYGRPAIGELLYLVLNEVQKFTPVQYFQMRIFVGFEVSHKFVEFVRSPIHSVLW